MEFKDGDLVRYKPWTDWCHHGIARVYIHDGKTWAVDTYWGSSPTDNSLVDLCLLHVDNIIGNEHTFGPVRYPDRFEDFLDKDRYSIPMGGSSGYERVRIGASPDPTRQEEWARYEVEKATNKIQSAIRDQEWMIKEYKRITGKDYSEASRVSL